MIRLAVAASFAALALAAPAAAQDPAAARRAVLASMVGHWTGSGEERDRATGEMIPAEDSFTLAVISDDGLDFAFWSADQLTISEATADGMLRDRTWVEGELVNERTHPMPAIQGPDAEGDWTLVDTMEIASPEGERYEQRAVYTLEGGTLTIEAALRPLDGDGELTPVARMSYTKAP